MCETLRFASEIGWLLGVSKGVSKGKCSVEKGLSVYCKPQTGEDAGSAEEQVWRREEKKVVMRAILLSNVTMESRFDDAFRRAGIPRVI